MSQATLHAFVTGRVQGVFFRVSTRDEAERLGVAGWVRNLPDGRVEVYAVGSESTLEAFLDWVRHGPPGARVDDVNLKWGTTEAFDQHFTIKG